jgi:hypothetical protein
VADPEFGWPTGRVPVYGPDEHYGSKLSCAKCIKDGTMGSYHSSPTALGWLMIFLGFITLIGAVIVFFKVIF